MDPTWSYYENISDMADIEREICSWSINDIQNSDLLRNKLPVVPHTFGTEVEYCCLFGVLSLEEIRANLQEGFDIGPRDQNHALRDLPVTIEIESLAKDFTRKRSLKLVFRCKSTGYRSRPIRTSDVLLVTASSNIQRAQTTSSLIAVVTEAPIMEPDGKENVHIVTVTVVIGNETATWVESSIDALVIAMATRAGSSVNATIPKWNAYASLLSSIPVARRIRHCLTDPSTKFFDYISYILGIKSQNKLLSTKYDIRLMERLLTNHAGFNQAQMRCIHHVLSNEGIHLVHGPPGTGKTHTLVAILMYLMSAGIPTMQVAPTNVAVGQVALRLMEKFDFLDEKIRLTKGDIVLIGNSDLIDLKGPLDDIFLYSRLKRIRHVAQIWPTPMWKFRDLLESFPDQYDLHLTEKLKESEDVLSVKSTIPEDTIDSPWTYFMRQYMSIEKLVRKGLLVYVNDLPSSFQHPSAVCVAKKFLDLLFKLNIMVETCARYNNSENFAELYRKRLLNPEFVSLIIELIQSAHSVTMATESLLRNELKDIPHIPGSSRKAKPLRDIVYENARIVFATAGSSTNVPELMFRRIHTIIVDEATQLVEGETLPLLRAPIRRLVLAGDHKQLPATVKSVIAMERGYSRSLFERLHENGFELLLLDEQYRMHPEISEFPRRQFYDSKLKDNEDIAEKRRVQSSWHYTTASFGPLVFFDIKSGMEERDPIGQSVFNETECDFLVAFLKIFGKKAANFTSDVSIGVISPYAAQVRAISDRLAVVSSNSVSSEDGPSYRLGKNVVVQVKSVDGFQGQERDIIVMSLVRSNRTGALGFVDDARRLNVALTRGRHSCWIVGNSITLTRRSELFKALIQDIKSRNLYIDVSRDKHLSKLINVTKAAINTVQSLFKSKAIPTLSEQIGIMANTLWKVIWTKNALDATRELIKDHPLLESIFKAIHHIASGRRAKYPVLHECKGFKDVIEVTAVGRYSIVWSIYLDATEYEYRQIIQIFEIVSTNHVTLAVNRSIRTLSRHTDEFLRLISNESRVTPMSFPKHPKVQWYTKAESSNTDDNTEQVEIEDSLVIAKRYQLTAKIIQHIYDETINDMELPLEVGEDEQKIINNSDSMFVLGRSGTGKTTVMTLKIYNKERVYYLNPMDFAKPRQLLVTASSKLSAAIETNFRKLAQFIPRDESIEIETEQVKDVQEVANFAKLGSPAFLSFLQFLLLLDRSLQNPMLANLHAETKNSLNDFTGEEDDEDYDFNLRDGSKMKSNSAKVFTRRRQEVTFERFVSNYWPHLPNDFTKKHEPSLLWTEIQSSIKGSLESLNSPNGRLLESDYVALAESRNSMFNAKKREWIYHVFMKYEELKRQKRDWDMGDLTSHIYREFKDVDYNEGMFDFVYIDEVQDLTQAGIAVFKYICRNPNGFIFGGDTAQTISAGVGFRFEDVRSLFYKDIMPFVTKREIVEADVVPNLYTLPQNYRSHSGVLELAACIIEMVYHFFPSMIDKLDREQSLIAGPRPILLKETNIDDLLLNIFGQDSSNKTYEFGAEQAIIVRDDETKQRLSALIDTALILTVFESKGLEFDDVLCFDFFASSKFDSWRVVYNFDPKTFSDQICPAFSMEKHRMLVSELKALYVLCTRAKKNLWWFDSDETKRKPMLDIFEVRKLIRPMSGNDKIMLLSLVKKSSSEEWQRLGKDLFDRNLYQDARRCFVRAGDHRNTQLCNALLGIAEAERLYDERKFVKSQRKCLEVGAIYQELNEFQHAAEYFVRAQAFDRALKMYILLQNYTSALECCTRTENSLVALDILRKIQGQPQHQTLINKMARRFALLCHSKKELTAMLSFLELLSSHDLRRNFLKRYKYYDELLDFEKSVSRWDNVARIYEDKGDWFQAAISWKDFGDGKELSRVAVKIARIQYTCSFNHSKAFYTKEQVETIVEHLNAARQIGGSTPEVTFELRILVLLYQTNLMIADWQQLLSEARKLRTTSDRVTFELVCLQQLVKIFHREIDKDFGSSHFILDNYPPIISDFVTALIALVRKLTETEQLASSIQFSDYERLFCLEHGTKADYFMINRKLLKSVLQGDAEDGLSSIFAIDEIKIKEFGKLAKNYIIQYVHDQINEGFRNLKRIMTRLQPCKAALTESSLSCGKSQCQKIHSIDESKLKTSSRVSLQILIVELASAPLKISGFIPQLACQRFEIRYANKFQELRDDLITMLFSSDFSESMTLVKLKQSSRVTFILEEYKLQFARINAQQSTLAQVAEGLLLSELTSTMIRYELFDKMSEMPGLDTSLQDSWRLIQAFRWLQTSNTSQDSVGMAAWHGACVLLQITAQPLKLDEGFKYSYPPIPPHLYMLLLEKFVMHMIIRFTRFANACLPARLFIDLLLNKNDLYSNVPNLGAIPEEGITTLNRLKSMMIFLLDSKPNFLDLWFGRAAVKDLDGRSYRIRILSLLIALSANCHQLCIPIGQALGRIEWVDMSTTFGKTLCASLSILQEHRHSTIERVHTNNIKKLLLSWKDPFVVVGTVKSRNSLPWFMRSLRRIEIDYYEPFDETLRRAFDSPEENIQQSVKDQRVESSIPDWDIKEEHADFFLEDSNLATANVMTMNTAAPVIDDEKQMVAGWIVERIQVVVKDLRARIKKRNSITQPRERYEFEAEEIFRKKGTGVSEPFKILYKEKICKLRADLSTEMEKIERIIKNPPSKSELPKTEVLIDEMLTYQENIERLTALLVLTNIQFADFGNAAVNHGKHLMNEATQLLEKGNRLFAEIAKGSRERELAPPKSKRTQN